MRYLIAAALLIASPVIAQEKSFPCGKTVDDCQKFADLKDEAMADLSAALELTKQQRNNSNAMLSDAVVKDAVAQQKAQRKAVADAQKALRDKEAAQAAAPASTTPKN